MKTARQLNNEATEAVTAMTETTVDASTTTETPVNTLVSLFAPSQQNAESFNRANQLDKTAELTQLATDWADHILRTIHADEANWADKVNASFESHDKMDELIKEIYPIEADTLEFLKGMDDDTTEKMIRSQQSKRSRAKSKAMTLVNYRTMLIGAVAENMLRIAAGKAKNSSSGMVEGDVGYTTEQLYELAQDAEKLKKAIRNVQSKKSIMQSKQGFDKESPRYKALLATEAQLKKIRDQSAGLLITTEAEEAIARNKEIEDELKAIDTTNMTAEELAQAIDRMKDVLASN